MEEFGIRHGKWADNLSICMEFSWCSGHRLLYHPGKCRNLHGHNYRAEVRVGFWDAGEDIDSAILAECDRTGMVIDFSTLKSKINRWIDDNWDHAFLFNRNDGLLHAMFSEPGSGAGKHFITAEEPTAENMAEMLATITDEFCMQHSPQGGLRCLWVQLWETPKSSAIWVRSI